MNRFHSDFFHSRGLLVLSSLMVVFVRNVVHAAVALVAALLLIAIFFITLQAPMVGVLQVWFTRARSWCFSCSLSCFSIP